MKNVFLLSADREPISLNARISKILEALQIKGVPPDRVAFIHSNSEDAVFVKESFLVSLNRGFEDIAIDSGMPDFYFLYATLIQDIADAIIIIPSSELFDEVFKIFAKKDKSYSPSFRPEQVASFLPVSKYRYDVEVL